MPGLLIVNADDLGADTIATDRTLECFGAGAITSATAMMFMRDSERGARLAQEAGLPVGLHLNLTQRYDGDGVPAPVARRQDRVVRFMADPRRRRLGLAPHLAAAERGAIRDQLACFRALYGGEPTHLDGHNHIHLNPTVFACLPKGIAIRPAHDIESPSRLGRLGRLPQRLRHALLAGWHPTVDHFLPVVRLHPAFGGSGLERALALADRESVELMVHPAEARVFSVLREPAWPSLLTGHRLGSYADLA
jgi:predicted glycoside hydrolase/deacetylase ChbG (UPF0249 family)